jgi:calcineurin-like phosphoesterase family protein
MTTFLISDTHFGPLCHNPNVQRRYADVGDMDSAMQDFWQRTVRPGDTVIHLGDFAHRYPADKLPNYSRL